MASNHPIGVFDSGVGGLTAVKELRALLPHEDIVYFATPAELLTAIAAGTPSCATQGRM